MSKPARPSFRRTPSRSRTAAIDWCFIRKSKRPGALISRSRRPAGIRSNHTFAKTPRRGFGCINIGDTNRPRPIGPIRFTRERMAGSINKSARPNWFRREPNVIQTVDKSPCSFSSTAMRIISRLAFVAVPVALSMLTGCQTGGLLSRAGGGPYHVTAYKPNDPSAVRVKVSLSKQNVYVMEGDRCLMAAAVSVGLPNKPTPRGSFTIYSKQAHKRSGSYGFSVSGNNVTPCSGNCGGRYVGYPMGYWCEFAPGYGFHQGFVHPVPRTHGCIRLHGEAAPKFFASVAKMRQIAASYCEHESHFQRDHRAREGQLAYAGRYGGRAGTG